MVFFHVPFPLLRFSLLLASQYNRLLTDTHNLISVTPSAFFFGDHPSSTLEFLYCCDRYIQEDVQEHESDVEHNEYEDEEQPDSEMVDYPEEQKSVRTTNTGERYMDVLPNVHLTSITIGNTASEEMVEKINCEYNELFEIQKGDYELKHLISNTTTITQDTDLLERYVTLALSLSLSLWLKASSSVRC